MFLVSSGLQSTTTNKHLLNEPGCKHLQSGVRAAQRSLGVGSSDEAGDQGGPAQRKLELDVFTEICAEGDEAEVVGQLEGGGGSGELLLDGQRQQRTDAV